MSEGSTIGNDVQSANTVVGALSEDEAADALLRRWTKDAGDNQPSKGADEEGQQAAREETDEHDAAENDEHAEGEEPDSDAEDHAEEGDAEEAETEGDEEEGEDGAETRVASDDHVVEVAVDGETKRVSVGELKRLFGQEAALTRKSQEVASLRKKAEDDGAKYTGALERMFKRAEERWKPFSEVDFLLASKNMSAEDFALLRKEAQEAHADYQFFKQELDGYVEQSRSQAQQDFQNRAREAVKILQDPEKGIPGWNQQLYDDIRSFAVKNGMDQAVVNSIIDPAAIKIIHLAMQASKATKVATTKIAKAPKNVVKTTRSNNGVSPKAASKQRAIERLRATGSEEDAAKALLAKWNVGRDD